MKVAFYDTKPYDRASFEPLGEANQIRFKFFEDKLTEDTAPLARGCDAVCVFVNDNVNAAVIDLLCDMGIRVLLLRCAGFNNVDLRHASGKLTVLRVPAYSPYAIAEHAMALLLTSIRRIHKAYIRTRDFNFSLTNMVGFDLHGKTVGVVGTGKIGRCFINICRGFGMKVLCYDPFPADDSSLSYVPLDRLFRESDIISFHCPLTPETHHVVNAESLATMKKGVVLINTSRGALNDRPDNAERVVYLAESLGYELAMPERDLYRTRLDGQPPNENGTQYGDRGALYEWVAKQEAAGCDRYILSLDQLLSGGLVSSRAMTGENPVTLSSGETLVEAELLTAVIDLLAADENNRIWLLDTVMRLAATTGYGGFGLNEYNALRTYGMAPRPHLEGTDLTIGNIVADYPLGADGTPVPVEAEEPLPEGAAADYLAARERKLRLSDALFDALEGTEGRFHVLVGIDEEAENAHILEAAKKLWGDLNHRVY